MAETPSTSRSYSRCTLTGEDVLRILEDEEAMVESSSDSDASEDSIYDLSDPDSGLAVAVDNLVLDDPEFEPMDVVLSSPTHLSSPPRFVNTC